MIKFINNVQGVDFWRVGNETNTIEIAVEKQASFVIIYTADSYANKIKNMTYYSVQVEVSLYKSLESFERLIHLKFINPTKDIEVKNTFEDMAKAVGYLKAILPEAKVFDYGSYAFCDFLNRRFIAQYTGEYVQLEMIKIPLQIQ